MIAKECLLNDRNVLAKTMVDNELLGFFRGPVKLYKPNGDFAIHNKTPSTILYPDCSNQKTDAKPAYPLRND